MSSPFTGVAENSTLRKLERTVERQTGQRAEALRSKSLTQLRKDVEQKIKGPMRFISRFPLIGRGNVMRDRIVNHQDVEKLLDESLK